MSRNKGETPKIRILFVCHGNICRSPMCEFVMKKLVADRGLADKYEIASRPPRLRRYGADGETRSTRRQRGNSQSMASAATENARCS